MHAARQVVRTLAVASAALGLFAALACGGNGGDSTTGPGAQGTPTPPSGPTVTPSLGSGVAPAAATVVRAYLSVGDSVPARAGVAARALGLAVDSGSVPVFAVNAAGEPIAAAFTPINGAVALTPTSTAVVLTRVLIPSAEFAVPGEAALRQAIAQRPEFPALVDSVQAVMARGASYATSSTVVAQAAAVAVGVIGTLPAPAGSRLPRNASAAVLSPGRARATIAVGPPAFRNYPVSVSGGSGSVTFTNGSFASFSLTITPPQNAATDDLPGRRQCFLCWPPSPGVQPTTKTYPLATTGPFTATVSFGTAERNAAALQSGFDLFEGILRVAGIAAPEDALAPVMAVISALPGVQQAATQADWASARQAVKDGIVGAAPDIGRALAGVIPQLAARSGVQSFFRAIALPLAVFDTGFWLGSRINFYSAVGQYWSTPPEAVPFCISTGAVYNACTASLAVSLSNLAIPVGATAQANAIGVDASGDTLTGLGMRWAVTSGSATIAPSGIVTPTASGIVTISATTADGITASASFSVLPAGAAPVAWPSGGCTVPPPDPRWFSSPGMTNTGVGYVYNASCSTVYLAYAGSFDWTPPGALRPFGGTVCVSRPDGTKLVCYDGPPADGLEHPIPIFIYSGP